MKRYENGDGRHSKERINMLTPMHVEKPPPHTKFVAFFNDGSGATLFKRCRKKYISADGEYFTEEILDSYSSWMALPDKFEFWFERK